MKRLTVKTLKGVAVKLDEPASEQEAREQLMRKFSDVCEKLAHYEDLEESGRLVVLPCKVGETVYVTVEACEGGEFCPYNGGFGTPRCDEKPCEPFVQPLSFEPFMLGEEFYLTNEEAEAALKGGGQDE